MIKLKNLLRESAFYYAFKRDLADEFGTNQRRSMYGFWLSPDGDFYEVKFQQHNQAAEEIFQNVLNQDPKTLYNSKFSDRILTPEEALMSIGWIRGIVKTDTPKDELRIQTRYPHKPTQYQTRKIKDFAAFADCDIRGTTGRNIDQFRQ